MNTGIKGRQIRTNRWKGSTKISSSWEIWQVPPVWRRRTHSLLFVQKVIVKLFCTWLSHQKRGEYEEEKTTYIKVKSPNFGAVPGDDSRIWGGAVPVNVFQVQNVSLFPYSTTHPHVQFLWCWAKCSRKLQLIFSEVRLNGNVCRRREDGVVFCQNLLRHLHITYATNSVSDVVSYLFVSLLS